MIVHLQNQKNKEASLVTYMRLNDWRNAIGFDRDVPRGPDDASLFRLITKEKEKKENLLQIHPVDFLKAISL